jgi:protein SCO1/2
VTRRRPVRAVAGVVLIVLVAVAAVTLAAGGRSRPPQRLLGPLMPAGFRPPPIALRDQHGQLVRLAAYRGRVVVLTPLHSLCHAICPVTVQQIRGAVDDLGPAGAGIVRVGLSVAPKEDTPAHVRAFLARQRVGPGWHYLTGSPARLRPIWKGFGLQPETGPRENHTAFIFLIDRRGVVRVGYPSAQVTPDDLVHDLRVLLAEQT